MFGGDPDFLISVRISGTLSQKFGAQNAPERNEVVKRWTLVYKRLKMWLELWLTQRAAIAWLCHAGCALSYKRDTGPVRLLISAHSLGVYYCQQLTLSVCLFVRISVPLSVTLLQIASYFFVSRWNRAIFLAVISPCASLQTLFFDFWFRPP